MKKFFLILLFFSTLFATSNITLEKRNLILEMFHYIAKYSSNRDNLNIDAIIDELKLADQKNMLTKENIYKIVNKYLPKNEGFYPKKEFLKQIKITQNITIKHFKDILYIKIVSINNLKPIKKLLLSHPKKIIIDFRDNHTMSVDLAYKFANMFMDKNEILTYRKFNKDKILYANKKTTLVKNAKVVVLVNHNTSKGAEVISKTFSVSTNIIILGQDTKGDTALYKIGKLKNGDFYRFRVGEMFYSLFGLIDGVGFRPDYYIYEDNPPLDKTLISALKYLKVQK